MGVTKDEDPAGGKPAFSDQQREEIGAMVNGAMASYLKRPAFKELLAGTVTEAMGAILPDAIKAAMPKPADPPADEGKGKGKKGEETPELPAAWKERFDAMERENRKLHDKVKLQDEEKAAAAKAARETAERGAVEKALTTAGVPAAQARAAALMIHLEKRTGEGKPVIHTDENGQIFWTVKGKYGEEPVPVEKGVAEFMKDEGKAFLPPSPGGSGGGGGGGGRGAFGSAGGRLLQQGNPGGDKPTKAQKLATLAETLINEG